MSLSKKEIKELSNFTCELALGAGKVLKNGFNKKHQVKLKGRIDPVTEADLKSEKHIVSSINKRYPDHAILAEEGSGNGEEAEFRWIIDPLDGTVNYAHGFPIYCVSIGLEYKGKILAGAVYDPERDELFHAARGMGSFMNKKKISISKETNLERALLATGFSYTVGTDRKNNLGLFARMVKKAQAVRRPGSAAIDLCWLAAGRIDGFWELYLHPWDTAAALVIVEEAGGKVTRMNGNPYSVFNDDILAGNSRLHKAIKTVLTNK
jgi:myo-inositol-1(or 4)-monophosphatase